MTTKTNVIDQWIAYDLSILLENLKGSFPEPSREKELMEAVKDEFIREASRLYGETPDEWTFLGACDAYTESALLPELDSYGYEKTLAGWAKWAIEEAAADYQSDDNYWIDYEDSKDDAYRRAKYGY